MAPRLHVLQLILLTHQDLVDSFVYHHPTSGLHNRRLESQYHQPEEDPYYDTGYDPRGEWVPLTMQESKKSSELATKGETNEYYKLVATLSPKEMIGRFARTAPKRVQDAVKQTIVGLLGNAETYAKETMTVTTSERLANLMFQLQMTGYMFKNAEYRVTLAQSLDFQPAGLPKIKGAVTVNVGETQIAVDADAYMQELRDEVEGLRSEVAALERQSAVEQRKDLLGYLRSMPEQQLAELTGEVTDDVLDAMKKLVYSIMRGLPGMQTSNPNDTETAIHQTSAAMAQLCMWQLIIGYNLRDLEARKQQLLSSVAENENLLLSPPSLPGGVRDDDDDE